MKEDGFDFIQDDNLEYHLNEVKISLKAEKERTEWFFHFVLSSVLSRQFRICLTNAQDYAHTPTNIQSLYPKAQIFREHFTGTTQSRPVWDKLVNQVQTGDSLLSMHTIQRIVAVTSVTALNFSNMYCI